jgi:periplasmic divalent cation tolerance protein
MPEHVLALTTLPLNLDADALAHTLVEERLVACVNVLPPMRSTYRWKEEVEQEGERQVIMKTTRDRVSALETRLRELHPYDVPEFIVVPIVSGSEEYLRWVTESTSPEATQ